ncbi:ribonuclease III [Corynebacterium caspium]|uniref:ribonuclease III n=1 Tax=Corynebacterium caspium TaxID=234828 RepID=UPI00036AB40D|nr:ribonuclease III [Corynebacterium caspium]WKD59044.1 Ribonuclease 3 [Corynebacterium caspium DSM 44850]
MSRKKPRLTGEDALIMAFKAIDHRPLIAALGVDLSEEILCLALTHRSFANENGMLPNNERLEFLGDAVLGLSVATKLYQDYPARPESDISKMRASVVSRYGCAAVARSINLGAHLLLGKGELLTDGRDKDSILADAVEALLGAVYLEYNYEVARDVVLKLFGDKIATASSKGMHEDWKTELQERVAELKLPMPEYTFHSEGPEHELIFTAYVSVAGVELGRGEGKNKKLAEQSAAQQACNQLLEASHNGQLQILKKAAEDARTSRS